MPQLDLPTSIQQVRIGFVRSVCLLEQCGVSRWVAKLERGVGVLGGQCGELCACGSLEFGSAVSQPAWQEGDSLAKAKPQRITPRPRAEDKPDRSASWKSCVDSRNWDIMSA